MYRPSIRVLDCTIRDGGLVNRHAFDHDFVRRSYQEVSRAGVDWFEIGYINSPSLFSGNDHGPWKFCAVDDVRRATEGVENGAGICVMADVGRVDLDRVPSQSDSPYAMVRVASYVKGIDKAIALCNEFSDRGYETCVNLIALSRDLGPELDEAFDQIECETRAKVLYLVDSFGAFYPQDVERLVQRARRFVSSKELGFHGHNNQQLAFSNTIEAIIHGVNWLDATVYGMGRAAGNCTLELLLGYLRNPRYDIRPVLDLVARDYLPLREQFEWGYIIPHMIAGQLNQHPQEALSVRKGPDRDNYRSFWEKSVSADGD